MIRSPAATDCFFWPAVSAMPNSGQLPKSNVYRSLDQPNPLLLSKANYYTLNQTVSSKNPTGPFSKVRPKIFNFSHLLIKINKERRSDKEIKR